MVTLDQSRFSARAYFFNKAKPADRLLESYLFLLGPVSCARAVLTNGTHRQTGGADPCLRCLVFYSPVALPSCVTIICRQTDGETWRGYRESKRVPRFEHGRTSESLQDRFQKRSPMQNGYRGLRIANNYVLRILTLSYHYSLPRHTVPSSVRPTVFWNCTNISLRQRAFYGNLYQFQSRG
jgi:hypothetical protein